MKIELQELFNSITLKSIKLKLIGTKQTKTKLIHKDVAVVSHDLPLQVLVNIIMSRYYFTKHI